ncbi:MAG TPA: ferrous iron transport protein B, partial [Candidatus Ruthenibacterium merdigallinarum]|nr:ferrous iron transport protein B [Candidatus Ruthenibacterium merdigallinarum]
GAAERAVEEAEDALRGAVPDNQLRWWAVKAIERDEKALGAAKLPVAALKKTEALSAQLEKTLDDDAESIITGERYAVASAIMEACASRRAAGALSASDKIDRIVTNRWLALPIFVAVMFGVYYLSVTTVGTMMTDWVNDVLFGEIIPPAIESFLVGVGCAEWLQSLVLDGIVAGVGAVLGFLPQMMVLFLLLAILEDCGYMARIAFIMDRIFRRFGLSGKSFIPMLIGTGCGVPAVMGSRTIENDRDRKLTIMTTTFIPCSAKVPIIGLIAGALFGGAWWVAPSAYFVGVAAIVCSGIILKKTKLFAGDPAPFVMELPAYHIPRVKGVLIHMWDRSKAFVKKAGSVIFLSTVLIWLLSSFNWRFEMVEESESMLAAIGSAICFIFAPLGWGDWRATVAAFTGLIAKENVVGTFGILYGFGEVDPEASEAIWSTLASSFSMLSAYSFLVFNLLCAPCFAAIGAIRREMGSGKWTWIAIGWQCGLAYAVSLMIYQLGSFVTGGGFGLGTAVAIALLAAFVWLLVRPDPNAPRRLARTAAARANG